MKILLEEINAYELEKLRNVPSIIYVGSVEHHGVLALGTDNIIARCISKRLEEDPRLRDLKYIELPLIPISASSEHRTVGVALGLPDTTVIDVLYNVFKDVAMYVSKYIIAIVTHGGVCRHTYIAARRLRIEIEDVHVYVLCIPSIIERVLHRMYGLNNLLIHGGAIEASLLCACFPNITSISCHESVDRVLQYIRNRYVSSIPTEYIPWIGKDFEELYQETPPASIEFGEILLQHIVDEIVKVLLSASRLS